MLQKASATLVRWLGAPRARTVVVLLGLALVSPSLASGLAADDWFHRLVLGGSDALAGVHHRPLDLFVFSNGDPAVGHAQQESGMLAWWADPTTAIAYFRPLSAATHWLDYALYPEAFWLMHAQNLAWFGAALVALGWVYRRFLSPPWLAALALLLYAIDDAHGFVVSWIANRNALIALALGLPVIALHDVGRRGPHASGAHVSRVEHGDARAAWAAPALFGVALLAGESAVAAGAYLLAYAVFMDPRPVRQRLLSLAPYAAVFVAWRLVYAGLGYGTHGSGLSVDPVHDPVGFVKVVAVRLPVLLLAQLALPPSDVWEIFPAVAPWAQPVVLGLAVVVPLLLAAALGQARQERETRFWALGTLLAALPACSQVPSDRLLLFTGVGAMGLVARLLGALLGGEPWAAMTPARRLGSRLSGAAIVALHLVIAPLWLPFRARGAADVASLLSRAERTLPSDGAGSGRTVVLVNPPADAFAGYVPMWRAAFGKPLPGTRLRWLATGASAGTLTRLDDRTVAVSLADGFMSLASERMQRNVATHPLLPGDVVRLSGMEVTITEVTADRRPRAMRARFDVPLEDPTLVFLAWSDAGYVPFAVPRVGETVALPAMDFTKLQM